MAMATGGAGASALIMALNSAKTVKSTKAMLDNTKELNKAMENGALQSFNQMLSGLQNTGPIQSAFSVLFAQIQAQTTATTVDLMKELLYAFQSESGKGFIMMFTDLINAIIGGSTEIVKVINRLLDFIDTISGGTPSDAEMAAAYQAAGYGYTPPIDYTNPAYVDVPTYRPGVQEY